ncbi:chemotaxis protein CheA, partial [Clostridium tyrobutyricum]|uniref:chemotaxis protein CheA n=1 Tax=Clostridium tyrobutyricum TaxID=1519 RepID=UPI002011A628
GELKVTKDVVTVLFKCLDTLEQMLKNIEDGVDDDTSIDDIMEELEKIADNAKGGQSEPKEEEKTEEEDHGNNSVSVVELNEYDINVIKQANDKGYSAYEIVIELSENTLLKSARVFLIFKSLEEIGEIIKSVPGTEDLENENFDFEVQVVILSTKKSDEVKDILMNISEVDSVSVNGIDIDAEKKKKINQEVEVKPKPADISKQDTAKKVEEKKAETTAKPKPKAKAAPKKNQKPHKKVHQSVRVDLERLDKFMNMVSELVIHRTRLEQISSNYKSAELNETLEQVARTTSDLQDLVMKIRMLPLDTVFSRFPRLIRDLSVELDKEMELVIQGADTELDRTVIDEIGDPLLHLIRNSADHGIESKEERLKAGKNPVGQVRLIAYQEGTQAVIKVEDDGAGINVERVREKAESIGIDTSGMPEKDIKNLIFMEGFSTNKEVTDISGRGVGLDVVKNKIAALNGTVDLVSEEGKGSSFIIRLPLTLQIIQALLVKVGEETMAISLGYIDRVINYSDDIVKMSNNKEIIIYNGNIIPFVRVYDRLELEKSDEKKNYIVIVKVGEKTVGLMVDSLLGQKEIVIKPLGKTLNSMKEYIGATILGDGLVTLILDVSALV